MRDGKRGTNLPSNSYLDHFGGLIPCVLSLGGCLRGCLSCCLYPKPHTNQIRLENLRKEYQIRHKISTRGDKVAIVVHRAPLADLYVLVSHGNAEDITQSFREWSFMSRTLRVNIIQYEYPGYSYSSGKPSEFALYAAADAALAFILEDLGVEKNKVVLFGRSIGTGPTVDLACRHPTGLAGMVLQSPLTTAVGSKIPHQLALVCFCLCLPCCDAFRSVYKVGRICYPTLVLHGTQDQVVNIRNGREIYSRLRQPAEPYWVPGAGHNDVESQNPKKYIQVISSFLASLHPRAKADSRAVPKSGGADAKVRALPATTTPAVKGQPASAQRGEEIGTRNVSLAPETSSP